MNDPSQVSDAARRKAWRHASVTPLGSLAFFTLTVVGFLVDDGGNAGAYMAVGFLCVVIGVAVSKSAARQLFEELPLSTATLTNYAEDKDVFTLTLDFGGVGPVTGVVGRLDGRQRGALTIGATVRARLHPYWKRLSKYGGYRFRVDWEATVASVSTIRTTHLCSACGRQLPSVALESTVVCAYCSSENQAMRTA